MVVRRRAPGRKGPGLLLSTAVPSAEGETSSRVNGGYHQNGSLDIPALPVTKSNEGDNPDNLAVTP